MKNNTGIKTTINKKTVSIGHRILHLRKERGLTQTELADKVGIIQRLVSDYERDKLRLNPDMIIRFSEALGVNADELLGISNSIKPKPVNLKLAKCLKKIEELPTTKQNIIIKTIDAFFTAETSKKKS